MRAFASLKSLPLYRKPLSAVLILLEQWSSLQFSVS